MGSDHVKRIGTSFVSVEIKKERGIVLKSGWIRVSLIGSDSTTANRVRICFDGREPKIEKTRLVLFGSLSVPMAAAFSLPSCVRAGASVGYCRRPTTSYIGGGFPTSHACCSKRSRRISTVTVQRDVSPLSPSSDSFSTAAVAKTAGHYIREDYIVEKVTSSQVQELLKGERSVPLVIDFYATWCGPCILMAQELEMLAVEYESNALFVKVDTDDEYEFARDMQVRGLPTLYFISPDPSKDAIRTEGLVPPEMIKNIIDNEM